MMSLGSLAAVTTTFQFPVWKFGSMFFELQVRNSGDSLSSRSTTAISTPSLYQLWRRTPSSEDLIRVQRKILLTSCESITGIGPEGSAPFSQVTPGSNGLTGFISITSGAKNESTTSCATEAFWKPNKNARNNRGRIKSLIITLNLFAKPVSSRSCLSWARIY